MMAAEEQSFEWFQTKQYKDCPPRRVSNGEVIVQKRGLRFSTVYGGDMSKAQALELAAAIIEKYGPKEKA